MSIGRTIAIDDLGTTTGRAVESIVTAAIPAVAPAVALAVRRSGRVVYEAAFGWADPDAGRTPATPDLRFDLASVTKTVTTTCVLAAATAGRIAIDDPVATVIDALSGPRPIVDGGQDPFTRAVLAAPPGRAGSSVDPATVTVRQLLAHTSGLAPWRAVFEAAGPVPPAPTAVDPVSLEQRWVRGIGAICASPFVDRPGRTVAYSDLGFMLLGEAVRLVTGVALDVAVAQRVTLPLGLTSIGFAPLRAGVARGGIAPTSVDAAWRGRRCWGEVEDENAAGLGGVAGHAGLFGTARDVAAFGQAWLDRDPRLGVGVDLMGQAVREQARGPTQRRGLGWVLHPGPAAGSFLGPLGPASFGHTGFTGTSLAIDPERELVVACLTNRVYAGRANPGIDGLRISIHAALAGR